MPKCVCCKDKRYWTLTIDHIKGGGTKHRREVANTSTWVLVAREMRAGKTEAHCKDDYRVLCQNCNYGCRLNNGICPHTIEKEAMKTKIINALNDYGKIFTATLLTAYTASGKTPFTANSNDIKQWLTAALSAVLPVLIVALNPKAKAYGVGSNVPTPPQMPKFTVNSVQATPVAPSGDVPSVQPTVITPVVPNLNDVKPI